MWQSLLADVISVLAMTMSQDGARVRHTHTNPALLQASKGWAGFRGRCSLGAIFLYREMDPGLVLGFTSAFASGTFWGLGDHTIFGGLGPRVP